MTGDEANKLTEHYTAFPNELAAMKHRLAVQDPEALSYIEALELAYGFLEKLYQKMVQKRVREDKAE